MEYFLLEYSFVKDLNAFEAKALRYFGQLHWNPEVECFASLTVAHFPRWVQFGIE